MWMVLLDNYKYNISHRIHGAGIYANIWGTLMGSMAHHSSTVRIRHGYGDDDIDTFGNSTAIIDRQRSMVFPL